MFNVPAEADETEMCRRQSEFRDLDNDAIKFKCSIPSRRNSTKKAMVVETSPSVHLQLMSQYAWLDGFDKYPVDNFIPVRRCTNCQRFGHNAKQCQDEPRCGKCAGRYQTRSCQSISPTCVNCTNRNISNNKHESGALCCEVHQQVRAYVISLTNYG